MKKIKKKLTATWEIISTAELVESIEGSLTDEHFNMIYQGEFVPLLRADRVERKQIWNLVIKTTAQADDGTVHEHEMEWQFDKPMSMKEVLDGAKHIKVDQGGIKTRWKGVSLHWLQTVDEDLKGLTAVSAWATASCTAMVSQVNGAAVLLESLIQHIEVVV